MKVLQKNKSHKKTIFITSAIVLLLLVLAWYLFIYRGSVFGWSVFPTATTNNDATSSQATTEAQQQNGQTIKSNSIQSGTSGSDQPTAPTTIPNSSKKGIVVSITHANQSEPGADLNVGVLIGTQVSSGTCTLTLTRSGQTTVTHTSDAQASSSTSYCDFDVSGLVAGTWQLTVTFDNSDLTGSATQPVEVN